MRAALQAIWLLERCQYAEVAVYGAYAHRPRPKNPRMKHDADKYIYAIERLTTALECLATHPGDVRERLSAAYLSFHTLREDDFPPEHQEKWRWVKREMTKFGPMLGPNGEVWRGSVENTMKRVRNGTASKIAKAVYALYWAVTSNRMYE